MLTDQRKINATIKANLTWLRLAVRVLFERWRNKQTN